MTCNRFEIWVKSLKQITTTLHSVAEAVDLITHAASCADCGKAYDDWYYSSDNPNWEKYMKEDRRFRKAVEERKKGAG